MPAPPRVVQAVEAGIVASAHLVAFESVSASAQALQRLGQLTSGRWRSAGRDLGNLQEELETAFNSAAEVLVSRARDIGVPDDALWTVGDAAATLDLLRETALEEVDEDDARTLKVLEGEVLYGASFIEDPELPDRGTTLLFGWPEPLSPATWPWQANWVVGDGQDTRDDEEEETTQELDLFEAGEMEGDEPLLAKLADELGCSRHDARTALRHAAMALTRASLLSSAGETGEEYDENEE